MKQLRTILSLTLVLAIAFPASLFAQQTPNVPTNLNPQILAYLEQPQAVNVRKGILLTSLPLLSVDFSSPNIVLVIIFSSLVGIASASSMSTLFFPVLSLSESMILEDSEYLQKYLQDNPSD